MSAPQFSSKMLETLKRTWLLYESITYSTTVFWNICLEKANFAHFVSRPLGEKLVKHLFWQKWWIFKALKFQKLENANFAHFVSRLLDEKLLKHFYWQKWGILKALKLQKLKNESRPLGEKLPKDIFWQNWRLLKTLKQKLENAKFAHFISHPLAEKLPKDFFRQK